MEHRDRRRQISFFTFFFPLLSPPVLPPSLPSWLTFHTLIRFIKFIFYLKYCKAEEWHLQLLGTVIRLLR